MGFEDSDGKIIDFTSAREKILTQRTEGKLKEQAEAQLAVRNAMLEAMEGVRKREREIIQGRPEPRALGRDAWTRKDELVKAPDLYTGQIYSYYDGYTAKLNSDAEVFLVPDREKENRGNNEIIHTGAAHVIAGLLASDFIVDGDQKYLRVYLPSYSNDPYANRFTLELSIEEAGILLLNCASVLRYNQDDIIKAADVYRDLNYINYAENSTVHKRDAVDEVVQSFEKAYTGDK